MTWPRVDITNSPCMLYDVSTKLNGPLPIWGISVDELIDKDLFSLTLISYRINVIKLKGKYRRDLG